MKRKMIAILLTMTLAAGIIGCGMDAESGSSGTAKAKTQARKSKGTDASKESSGKTVESLVENLFGTSKKEGISALDITNMISDGYMLSEENLAVMPMWEPETPVIDWNTEEYKFLEENPWMSVAAAPFSTFAADVDTASYANLRRMLVSGQTIPVDAVRIEEMINYFSYDYPEPQAGEPFSVTTELAPCPWNANTELLLIGLQTQKPDLRERPASNLVFLVDVSGSMSDSDKLPLIQRAFRLLCEELNEQDRVSLVTYASGDKVVFEGVSGSEKTQINSAMEDLFASGGTNGSAGIQTAYEIAEKYYIQGGNNRIILATDGDLNIGVTDEGSLTRLIKEKAKSGVFLSVLGFGRGNISDTRMEALADNGNGNYNYIDSIGEARKVLIEEMGGTLFTVAKDVKLQVEFNPAVVKGYRLIGYENRTMATESFADDTKDGGEIGAGHCVTALYEIARIDSAQEIPSVESKYKTVQGESAQNASGSAEQPSLQTEYLTLNIRYKEPDGDTSKLLSYAVDASARKETMSENLSWAAGVAQIGMLLKQSEYAGSSEKKEVLSRMEALTGVEKDDYRKEFLFLFSRYTDMNVSQ